MSVEDSQREQRADRDERVMIPLDPEEALRGLLKVDPGSKPVEQDDQRGSEHESEDDSG